MTASQNENEKDSNDVASVVEMIDRELRDRFPSAVDDVKNVFVREDIDGNAFGSMTEEDIRNIFGEFSFGIRKALAVLAENRLAEIRLTTRTNQRKKNLKQMQEYVYKKLKKGMKKGRNLAKKGGRIIKLIRENQYAVVVVRRRSTITVPLGQKSERDNITDEYNSRATASTITVPLGEKLERDNITDEYNSIATASTITVHLGEKLERDNSTDEDNYIATASTFTAVFGEKLDRDNITDDYNSRATASNLEKEDLPEIKSRAPTGERSDCATNKSVKNESTESYGVYQREKIEKKEEKNHKLNGATGKDEGTGNSDVTANTNKPAAEESTNLRNVWNKESSKEARYTESARFGDYYTT